MDGAYLLSGLRLLEGAIVLVLDRTTLFPSKDGLAFDVISFQVLNVVGLTNRLDQSTHLVGKFGDEDHSLEMRRDGAFRCCHSRKSDEDGIDRKSRVGVPRDDDFHRCFEFLIGGGNPGFAISGLEVFPCYGGEHCVDVGVLRNGFLKKVQDGCGKCWVEAKHYVPQGSVVGVKPGVNVGLVPGGFRGIRNRFGLGSPLYTCFGDGGCGLVFRSGELVCDNLPLALGEEVVHHQWSPGLPVHGAVQDGDEGHEGGRHSLVWFLFMMR